MLWVLHVEFSQRMRVNSMVGKFIFLTTQTLCLIFLYAGGNLMCEVYRLVACRRLARMESVLNWMCCVVAGMTWFVFIMFYCVVWPDPKYQDIRREEEAHGKPFGFNSHVLHCAAVPMMCADTYLKRRTILRTALGRPRDYFVFFVCYGLFYPSLVQLNHRRTGAWPYPFMARLSPLQLVLFYAGCLGSSVEIAFIVVCAIAGRPNSRYRAVVG